MATVRNEWFGNGEGIATPVPEILDICDADFKRVEEWHSNPPSPTKAAVSANELFFALLVRQSRNGKHDENP